MSVRLTELNRCDHWRRKISGKKEAKTCVNCPIFGGEHKDCEYIIEAERMENAEKKEVMDGKVLQPGDKGGKKQDGKSGRGKTKKEKEKVGGRNG